jgi:glycine dehydrogenase subunit 1
MRFIPHTRADVSRMLDAIGGRSTAGLFTSIPQSLRDRAALRLPAGLSEQEVVARLAELAGRNRVLASFQGAGCYEHFVPSVVGTVLARSEFATAYTPYQPEVSQGTLQACFEFQTYVTILTGLDVANASMYDGASALAEAVLMALRMGGRRERVLLSAALHPEYRAVVETYLRGYGHGQLETVPAAADGRTDLSALESMLDGDVAGVCLGYPNVYGVIEDLAAAARLTAGAGALTISATPEALALALLRSPGECGVDIAVAEGQSFGLPISYGGPGVGLFATRRQHVRQMPGRLVGETVDEEGKRGYVLTLATREQHIRREKATSNICTNQGLAALAATTFLGAAGRRGLRDLARLNVARAHEVADRLEREAGLTRPFSAPFFNEFVVDVPARSGWFDRALSAGVVPGVRLSDLFPERAGNGDRLLVAVTECNTDEQIDALVRALAARRAA